MSKRMARSAQVVLAALLLAVVAYPWPVYGAGHAANHSRGDRVSLGADGQLRPFVSSDALHERWTARSRTWAKEDGSLVTRVFQQAVNVKDGHGGWRAADNRLRRDGASWVSAGGRYRASIPSSLGDGPIRMEHGSAWLALQLRGADVAASVDGEVASFADVAEGVTARWSTKTSAIKEELVLADATAASTFTFDVDASSGLTLKNLPNGSIAAQNAAGEREFRLSAPFAYDADKSLAPKGALSLRAERAGDAWIVRLSLSRRWLEGPKRAFPVTIDPTLSVTETADCFIDGEDTRINYCEEEELWVGHATGRRLHDHRGLLKFSLAGLPAAASVLNAGVHAYNDWNETEGPVAINAHQVTSSWTEDATWIRRDSTNNWSTAGGDFAAEPVDSTAPPTVNEWSSWTITGLVRGWYEDGVANNGIMLRDDGTTRVDSASTFISTTSGTKTTGRISRSTTTRGLAGAPTTRSTISPSQIASSSESTLPAGTVCLQRRI